jgi:hypothetical protein
MSSKEFYESGRGDLLIDEAFYPACIVDFLHAERKLLDILRPDVQLLVEVGCMGGRHLEWAVANNKAYLGLDIVERYVNEGCKVVNERSLPSERYRFVCGAAEDVVSILRAENVTAQMKESLLFFPFNSIGNMTAPSPVLQSLSETRAPFLISSYLTTDEASSCRADYYELCGYKNVRAVNSNDGVRFTSDDGLHSIAYHPDYLLTLAAECGFEMKTMQFSAVGIAYYSLKVHATFTRSGLNPE